MEIETLAIRLHHKGHFTKTRYSGGQHEIFWEDPDRFSYSVLMEFVKEMKYTEIGGVYVNNDGWKLLEDDKTLGEYTKGKTEFDFYIDANVDQAIPAMKQMQPHVIVRPRSSPFKAKEKKAEKRTFVTLKNINAEKTRKLKDMNVDKERRISRRKKLEFNQPDASPPREKECMGLSDYLKQFHETEGPEKETTIDELVKVVEGEGCNDYEMRRNENVAKNKAKLRELGIVPSENVTSCQKDKGKGKVTNDDASESEYLPDNNNVQPERQTDDEDDNGTSKRTKKVKRQRVELGAGTRTRSRATKVPDSSEKNKIAGDATSPPVEVNKAPVVSLKEKLKNLRDGPGSMTAYLKLRELEKLQLEKEIPRAESQMQQLHSQSVETPVDEAPKRKRGKTKMNHVHNRAEKKRITLNDLNQPVANNGKLLAEFSSFLGTTVRQFVSLTCASWHQVPEKELLWEYVKDKYIVPEDAKPWVNKSMGDQFRSYKSRIKRDYYKRYPTDEERLEHRPEEVPVSDWMILLKYWGDEKVKEIAKRNSESRKKITETHTTGSTSFAQVANKLLLEKLEKLEKEKLEKQEILGKMPVNDDGEGNCEDQESVKISTADIYIATRKRKENHEYKLPEEVLRAVNEKIVDVKKALQTEGVEAANKLVHGGKEHSPSYLIGRLIRKKEPNSKSSASSGTSSVQLPVPDQFVSDLTTKIRAQLQQEMDQKLDQKVREMMKMLAEKNPNLKLDTIEDSEKSVEVSHDDVSTD